MHKASPYVRTLVTLHNMRDKAKDAVDSLQERGLSERVNDGWNRTRSAVKLKTRSFFSHPETVPLKHLPQKYGYVFRPKSCWELVLLSGTVCGIEFCYSAETAFVTPILLSLGLNIKFVTMIWCLSPLIGLFLTPILGSMSDSCESRMGRRRPFILMYSIGILLGLILVPNGHRIGLALGDQSNVSPTIMTPIIGDIAQSKENIISRAGNEDVLHNITSIEKFNNTSPRFIYTHDNEKKSSISDYKNSSEGNQTNVTNLGYEAESSTNSIPGGSQAYKRLEDANYENKKDIIESNPVPVSHIQPWSIAFTVIGTILLDFCSDACQSPSRTYLLDVSLPNDHAAGLSTFTLMAGLGGSMGYVMGGIHWETTFLGQLIGSQVNVVFAIVTVVFIVCLISTVCSFPEIPLPLLDDPNVCKEYLQKLQEANGVQNGSELIVLEHSSKQYGATDNNAKNENPAENGDLNLKADVTPSSEKGDEASKDSKSETLKTNPIDETDAEIAAGSENKHPTLVEYLKSIIRMPNSLKILCLTNLFCWMSLVCYSLYFTDFVAECVYGGDPQAPEDSEEFLLYKAGIRFGCWGMALYSLSCAVYSYFTEALVKKIGAKSAYIGGQLVYSVGMVTMALTRHKVAVILLSPTAGVMYATLFTMPYLLIAHYHCNHQFTDKKGSSGGIRGIGTDIAAVSSMVFLAQLILSLTMGSIVEAVGSNVATVCAAALLSACGAICATQVMYLDI